MDNNYLTISEVGKELGITYQGALKKLRTNKAKLKPYLILDKEKNIKGIKQEGLDELRNLPHRTSYANKVREEENLILNQHSKEVEQLERVIKTQEQFIEELKRDKEQQQAKITSLESELKAYRNGNFFTRLLGYKSKD